MEVWWVDQGCGREHQGPESSGVAEPISKWQPHGQNPGAGIWPDRAGVAERIQLGPPLPQATVEPALPIPGVLPGYGGRDQEASAGRPPQPDHHSARVIRPALPQQPVTVSKLCLTIAGGLVHVFARTRLRHICLCRAGVSDGRRTTSSVYPYTPRML